MSDPRTVLEQAIGTEPPLAVDWERLRHNGDRRVRRRRMTAVVAGTVTVAVIAAVSSLVIRSTDPVPASPPPATSTAATATETSAFDPATAGLAASLGACTVPITDPDGFSTPSTTVLTPPSTSGSAPAGTELVATDAADGLTGSLWGRLHDRGVTYIPESPTLTLKFVFEASSRRISGSASGRVVSADGTGWLYVAINSERIAAPECLQGDTHMVLGYPDGTAVTIVEHPFTIATSDGTVYGPYLRRTATAYHPDGTTVVVAVDDVTAGAPGDSPPAVPPPVSAGPPLTVEQVGQLAADPAFRATGATASEALGLGRSPMPDVVGLGVDQARSVLQGMGLTVVVSTTDPGAADAPAGSVVAQTPTAGQIVPDGTQVTLTVVDG